MTNALSSYRVLKPPDAIYALRQRVSQWTDTPVSIGIAPTKTLVKLANLYARESGVDVFCADSVRTNTALTVWDVQEIRGIGRRVAKRLYEQNVETLGAFCVMPSHAVRQQPGVRSQQELSGQPCQGVMMPKDRRNITSTGSFAHCFSALKNIEPILCNFVVGAAEKARRQGSVARALQVMLWQLDSRRLSVDKK